MNELYTATHTPSHNLGTRTATPQLRHSLLLSETFEGLERDVKRYDLMILVKRAGKAAGFTPRLIQLLDYYMAFTRDCDWEEGSNPIVFQSVTNTAMDLGICERQVQRMEQRLFELGALTWCDSGNHRRYGKRDPETGMLLYGYGVDLTPLASLRETLQNILDAKTAHAEAWRNIKRQISWYRGQIRSMLAAVHEGQGRGATFLNMTERYAPIAETIRSSTPIEQLRTLLDAHRSLHNAFSEDLNLLNSCELSQKESSKADEKVAHIENTNQTLLFEKNSSPSDKVLQEDTSVRSEHQSEPSEQAPTSQAMPKETSKIPDTEEEIILATGLQHITLKQALNAATENFRSYIPHAPRPMQWSDIVEAAWHRRKSLRISQSLWAEACQTLGRTGAAVAILIVDRAISREDRPVQLPAAYFRAMITRARNGQLNLQASVFAWMKKSFEQDEDHSIS